MSDYNKEQSQALEMVRKGLSESWFINEVSEDEIKRYLKFREKVVDFQDQFFGSHCTAKCYEDNLSACCSKEGIVTFFADVVMNALLSSPQELDAIAKAVSVPNIGVKCVFLSEKGCLWKLRPIVCQMFLCNSSKNQVFAGHPERETQWDALKVEEKEFTWPDRPVLFDDIEKAFIKQGYESPLMYMHNSPGLLRIKSKWAG